MAESVSSGIESLSILNPPQGTESNYNCMKCGAYESQLNQTLEELETATKIIDILKKELEVIEPPTRARGNVGIQGQDTSDQANSAEWTTVPAKRTSATVNRYNQHALTKSNQQIATWNKYALLHNLQDNDVDEALLDQQLHHDQGTQLTTISNETVVQHGREGQIPTIMNGKLQLGESQKSRGNKTKEWVRFSTPHNSNPRHTRGIAGELLHQHTVQLIGDSHLCDSVTRINQYLPSTYEATGFIQPGATSKHIVTSCGNEFQGLGEKDVIVLSCGANDIGKVNT
jgi:hypothetical protein